MTITKSQRLIRPSRPHPWSRRWAIAIAPAAMSAAVLYMHAGHYAVDAAFFGGSLLGVVVTKCVVIDFARTTRRRAGHELLKTDETAAVSDLSRNELIVLAQRHDALRRAATLVARGVTPAELLATVAEELAGCLNAETVTMLRFEGDEVVLLGRYTAALQPTAGVGRSFALDGGAAMAPIIVENRAWGLLVAGSSPAQPLRQNAESVLRDFADLAAIAVGNAAAREDLQSKPRKLYTAADFRHSHRGPEFLLTGMAN